MIKRSAEELERERVILLKKQLEQEKEKKRLADEDERQNNRLKLLEEDVRQISVLTTSVEKLAMSIESMVKEQASQGKRLEELENRDGEMWRKLTGYIITAIVGIVIGFIFKQIGM